MIRILFPVVSKESSASGAVRQEVVGMVRPTGFEPVTFGFGGRRSIQLSYGRMTIAGA